MLVLNEDQRMLMDSARGAIAAKAPIEMWRQLRAEASLDGFSRAFWRECAELGWTGVLVPQEFGGIDFGVTGAGLIAREMARTLAPSPFLSTAVLAASALRRSESAAAKAKWLPRIVSGEVIVAFAIDEGPRPTDQTQAMAVKSGQDWLVTAAKHFVLDGHVADAFVVESRRFAGTPALFLVEADASGLTRDARTLVDNRRVASVALERVQLPQDAVLGGVSLIEATLDVGRAVVAATLCGVAEEAFARTMSYLKERKQFDRRIGSFQALQHRAAKVHIDIENSWSATLKALQALDADAPSAAFDVAVAKAKASRTACEATAECLQMHGGIGMTDEFDIGLFLKRARVDSVLFGDEAFHADRVAMLLGY
ncbi:MAG: acyl-CoA dehydrogenase family protein [Roseiarcus sp.]